MLEILRHVQGSTEALPLYRSLPSSLHLHGAKFTQVALIDMRMTHPEVSTNMSLSIKTLNLVRAFTLNNYHFDCVEETITCLNTRMDSIKPSKIIREHAKIERKALSCSGLQEQKNHRREHDKMEPKLRSPNFHPNGLDVSPHRKLRAAWHSIQNMSTSLLHGHLHQ